MGLHGGPVWEGRRALGSPLTQFRVRPRLPERHHPQLGGEKDHCLQAAQSDALPV